MAVHRHAVIGSKQDDGVFRLAGFLERAEHTADVVVEVRDQAVVRGVLLLGAIDRRRIAAHLPGGVTGECGAVNGM